MQLIHLDYCFHLLLYKTRVISDVVTTTRVNSWDVIYVLSKTGTSIVRLSTLKWKIKDNTRYQQINQYMPNITFNYTSPPLPPTSIYQTRTQAHGNGFCSSVGIERWSRDRGLYSHPEDLKLHFLQLVPV